MATNTPKLPSPGVSDGGFPPGVVSFFSGFFFSSPQSPSPSFGRTQLPVLRLNPKVPGSPFVLPSPNLLLLLRFLLSSNCREILCTVFGPRYCWSQAKLAVFHPV